MALPSIRERKKLLWVAVVVVVGSIAQQAGFDWSNLRGAVSSSPSRNSSSDTRAPSVSARSATDALERIARAEAARESGFMITVDARVKKVLSDDLEGSRHQRFLIELADRRTLLVAHNIDLSERIPLRKNDAVRVHGQYEWNDRGGVLHWTHRDPDGRHAGGWIEHSGKRAE